MLFVGTFPGTLSEYIYIWLQALSNKLCRFKNQAKYEIFAVFVFLPFLAPLEKQ